MNNYEYIIASLPDFTPDKGPAAESPEEIIEFVHSQLKERDLALAGILEDGWNGDKLNLEFYEQALAQKNRFLREYFGFDLAVRNAKVRHLNKALGRPEDTDIFLPIEEPDQELEATLDKIYEDTDILAKERAIDRLVWDRIDEITTFDYFDIDAILGFLAKLHIAQRWMALDEESGRAMFRQLTQEVRSTFKGVNYEQ